MLKDFGDIFNEGMDGYLDKYLRILEILVTLQKDLEEQSDRLIKARQIPLSHAYLSELILHTLMLLFGGDPKLVTYLNAASTQGVYYIIQRLQEMGDQDDIFPRADTAGYNDLNDLKKDINSNGKKKDIIDYDKLLDEGLRRLKEEREKKDKENQKKEEDKEKKDPPKKGWFRRKTDKKEEDKPDEDKKEKDTPGS